MMDARHYVPLRCSECTDASLLGFDFSFAFQPIIDSGTGEVFSYEALVRGPAGEAASAVLDRVDERNRYRFDQSCRVRAIELASRLGLATNLNINFFPNAIYEPELCIRTTIEASHEYSVPVDRLIFEVTEVEKVTDTAHLASVIRTYQELGLRTAIDDFGAGHSGLTLLADYQPDFIKLDRQLVAAIEKAPPRQAILRGIVQVCRDLSIDVIAEGVETADELDWLRDAGLRLFQGYYLARPGFEELPRPRSADA